LVVAEASEAVGEAAREEVVRVVAGERVIGRRQRRAVDAAVHSAEEKTGLQFCVYLGRAEDDPRAHAESLFVQAGLHERPAVLLLVAPDHRRVEVVTAAEIRERLSDEACARAIDAMTPLFAEGRFVDGLVVGIGRLADEAGPSSGESRGPDLPNIVTD
jgi:uncharacterized membrane protein YgcG